MLTHCYTSIWDADKALPCTPLCQSDHCSILLQLVYRQKLKQVATILQGWWHYWMDQSEPSLRDCFHHTDWDIFPMAAVNIDKHADWVCRFIKKCMDDVLSKTVKVYPKQKPWINSDVCMALAAWCTAVTSVNNWTTSMPTINSRRQLRQQNMSTGTEFNNSTIPRANGRDETQ